MDTPSSVDHVPALGKGVEDRFVGEYSIAARLVIVTYDDDVVLEHDRSDFHGVVHIPVVSLSATQIADILRQMAEAYPESAFEGVEYAGREWL